MNLVGKLVVAAVFCLAFGVAGGALGAHLMAGELRGDAGPVGPHGPRGPVGPEGAQGPQADSTGLDGLTGAYVVAGALGCPSGTTTAFGNNVLTDVTVQIVGFSDPTLNVVKQSMQLCAVRPAQ